ncbi:PAS domain S-box protein [Polynucleobacter antarcticus]|uniref:histidine kinase n=1 Tax=Polynucleobacter antarcticus TaxID=1743162 RepID=A0A6M9PUD1_9BURK|nr:PAS domain S-box protein [Polynucleobacter antarcticus]QKM62477.1 PAS domain-containing sensor histidine kinase [Polynucleobacter antarcticus]
MKKIAPYIWKLKPLQWIRRIRGFRLVYTPLLAIIIFTGVMGIILGALQLQEKDQQESALYRELSIAKQRIQLRFTNNVDVLQSMGRDYVSINNSSNVKSAFISQAENLLQSNREIAQILWIDESSQRQWIAPTINLKRDWFNHPDNAPVISAALKKTIELSAATNRPAFSQFITLKIPTNESTAREVRHIFWQTIPQVSENETKGMVAVLYTAQGLLDLIPGELKSQYRFTLLTDNEKVLAISSDKNTPRRAFSNQTTLDMGVLSPNLILRIDTYPPATNLTFRMLIGVVLGLSAFVIWSLWSVLKQMQVRQEVEATLRAETNFRSAMENSTPVGIRAHDMNRAITYVNPAFCEMTGWSAAELIGLEPPFPFWPEAQKNDLSERMNLALELSKNQEKKIGMEGSIVNRNGTILQTRTFIAPLINEKGQQTGWVTSLIDISEPKKIREELAASQDRFITVLEGLDAAVSVVSKESGELLFANRFYRERFGGNAQGHFELAGGNVAQSGEIAPAIESPSLYQESESEEIQLLDESTGASKWYEVRRRFVPWVDGDIAQLLIATDITIRIEANELMRQQEERMQFSSRLTTMGEMASSLAHELNQPLSAISNYCMGVIKRLQGNLDPSLQTDIIPALQKASDQAYRAGTIIQRIKGFVKRSEPQRKPSDINEIVNDAVGLVEIEAHRHRFSITAKVTENLPLVDIDPVLILQVLVNLLKNSLDSLREVYPLSSRWSAPSVTISADLDTSTFPAMLRIQVTDAGAGIAETVIERMFEPFFSTKNDGMGMGLNICRSVIESHQGRLWAKNHMDVEQTKRSGCTFTILLPLEIPGSISNL